MVGVISVVRSVPGSVKPGRRCSTGATRSPCHMRRSGRTLPQARRQDAADSTVIVGEDNLRDDVSLMTPPQDARVSSAGAASTSAAPGQELKKAAASHSTKLAPTPEIVAIALVYFVQGILGLARLAVSFYYKDELHLDPATVAFLTGLSTLPWLVKPLYGFVSDTIPLFGSRRRSYLVFCGFLGAASWSFMSMGVQEPTQATIAIVVASLSTAFSDVVVDSIVVEKARGEPLATAGSLQSLCWASSSFGGLVSAYFSGSLVQDYGTAFVFRITAVFPMLVSLAALLVKEEAMPAAERSAGQGKQAFLSEVPAKMSGKARALWKAASNRTILLPAAFVFLWQATPYADSAMFFFQTNKLGFSPEFLGRMRLLSSIASLVGIGVYNTWLKQVPLKRMFFWTALLGVALGMTQLVLVTGLNEQLGLSNELFALGDTAMLTVLGQISFMPVLVLAAQLCPEGVEATLFAALMSVLNGGGFTGSALGALLTKAFGVTSEDFTNLAPLIAICTLSSLLPLPFLSLLPDSLDSQSASSGHVDKQERAEMGEEAELAKID